MKEINYALVGHKVKMLRKQANMTQDQLAEKCDISTSYLGHIERGSRHLSLDSAYKIAEQLGVSLDALILDGVLPNTNTLTHVEAIVQKQHPKKQAQFIRLMKVLAENIDEI